MPLGYDSKDLFFEHIWVKDAKFIIKKGEQNEAILLLEKQLAFVLLFYTLSK